MSQHVYGGPVVSVRDVDQKLGDNQVLRGVNFDIMNVMRPGMTQGQVVGLLGPSGIGKTRLFRLMAGLDTPDSGEILVGENLTPVRRGAVGVVAQHYPLFRFRTVYGNLVLAAKQAGATDKDAVLKVSEYIEKFGLRGHEKKYPSQLSGGQRQRVAIAQQLLCSENLLLMDEPFSGLDYNALRNVINFITDLSTTDELKTFVIVTHDITAAIAVSDTILLLGRDRNEDGSVIPGARVVRTYNLADMGLAWQGDLANTPQFNELLMEIRSIFATL